ncbi:heme/hemin ABC transporter substrate-binding protein [Leucobacter japonicus]|uniref:heme/hemin ABC transporter substrate-binding protein n=1 Tax=Leucobacter japonicus TaxID=1461259 RepID=UPI000A9B36A8|nr:ABC transporter substrate-binding protein [Leucobacter japonicus]
MIRGRRIPATAAAILTAALLLAGCSTAGNGGGDAASGASAQPSVPLAELQTLDDPKAYEGPSTAVLQHSEIEPIAENPVQTLPATVPSYATDGSSSDVVIESTDKVVAADLGGNISVTIAGLGFADSLVGVDQSTTLESLSDLPRVTSGGHTVNAEAIIDLHPDLVITDGTVGPRDVIEQLQDVGIQVVFVQNEASFAGAEDLARQVAAIYGSPETGEQLAQRIASEVDAKKAEIAKIAPANADGKLRIAFVYLRGTAGVYYLFGKESGADQLIEALGGVDVATDMGWDGMKPMTDEALVKANPDLILVMTKGIESVGGVDGLLEEKPAIAVTTAGEHRRFVDMEDGTILSFGPRSADILDALARAIYAPAAE